MKVVFLQNNKKELVNNFFFKDEGFQNENLLRDFDFKI
jgi:hypothetical protein